MTGSWAESGDTADPATAARMRVRAAWIDILFPAVLLHLGQGALVWAFHSTFLLTTVLGGLFVAVGVAAPPHAAAWRALALATLACLLPLTGTSGLVVAAAAAALLVSEVIWPPRDGGPPQRLARGSTAAGAGLAVAIGCGRGTRDFTPLDGHYSTLTLTVPVAIGLVWAALPEPTAP